MTTQQFIEKAIEGGWQDRYFCSERNVSHIPEMVLLDSLAWRAVGKVEGWDKLWYFGWFVDKPHGGSWKWVESGDESVHWGGMPNEAPNIVLIQEAPTRHMHGLIDALAEGRTVDSFLESL